MPLMGFLTRAMEAVIPNPPATTSQLEMLSLDNVTDLDSVSETSGCAHGLWRAT